MKNIKAKQNKKVRKKVKEENCKEWRKECVRHGAHAMGKWKMKLVESEKVPESWMATGRVGGGGGVSASCVAVSRTFALFSV